MNTREKRITDLKALQSRGYQIEKADSIKPNTGSETDKHLHAKAACARVLWNNGFRVSTEVKHEKGHILDVLGYGAPGRYPIGIELETGLDEQTATSYRELYYVDCMREIYCVDVSSLSWDCREMATQIAKTLGLEYEGEQ